MDEFVMSTLRGLIDQLNMCGFGVESETGEQSKGDGAMFAQKILVTPEMATMWLSRNGKNRKINLAHARRIAEIMSSGKWCLNGQTISFDDQGRLLDGQHRLTGVVLSGVSVYMLVVNGVTDDRAFQTYDTVQLKRGAHQIAMMMGDLKNATRVTAAARVIIKWEKSDNFEDFLSRLRMGTQDAPPEEVAAKAVEIQQEFNSIYSLFDSDFIKKTRMQAAWVALLIILKRIKPIETELFAIDLNNGLFEDKKHPLKLLNDRVRSETSMFVRDKKGATLLLILTVKAWNAYVSGKKLKCLRWNEGQNESIPTPIGCPK